MMRNIAIKSDLKLPSGGEVWEGDSVVAKMLCVGADQTMSRPACDQYLGPC